MKRKSLLLRAGILFLFGFAVALYPTAKTAVFQQQESRAILRFEQYRVTATHAPPLEFSDPKAVPADTGTVKIEKPFCALYEACKTYNRSLTENGQMRLSEQTMKEPCINPAVYGWEEEVFACLSIPSANIEAPVYLGTSSINLERGAALLGQTSMPIGGLDAHAVIGGHRTWNAIRHPFIGLEKVQIGDDVFLTNPWETLTYRVIATSTIYPDNLDAIRIWPGRDLLTVFTCTYPNSQRYIVTCERISEETEKHWNTFLLPWVA